MTKKQLEESLQLHSAAAAQYALASRETLREHEEAEEKFQREAGIIILLRKQIAEFKDDTKPNPAP